MLMFNFSTETFQIIEEISKFRSKAFWQSKSSLNIAKCYAKQKSCSFGAKTMCVFLVYKVQRPSLSNYFANVRLRNGHFPGIYPQIYSYHWSFYMQIHDKRAYFLTFYLWHITRSTCTWCMCLCGGVMKKCLPCQ